MLRAAIAALLFLQAATMCGKPAGKELVARHAAPFTISSKPAKVTLDVARSKSRLASAAKSDRSTVVLEIEGVAADRPPRFIVAVFIGEQRVGEVALYGTSQPQTFAFGVDDVVAKALRRSSSLEIRFLPESGLQGQPARPEAPVRIAAVSLSIEHL